MKTIYQNIKTLYNPLLKKYIKKKSFKITYKPIKPIIMEPKDDREKDKEKEKDDEEEEMHPAPKKDELDFIDIKLDPVMFGAEGISLKEDYKPSEEDKKILSYKRKREVKQKKLPSQVKKVKPKKASSIPQQLFNMIANKDKVTEGDIRAAGAKLKYELTPQNINFFTTLSEAKARLKRFGTPGIICKAPFHIFLLTPFYEATSVITNDVNAWNCYYWSMFKTPLKSGGVAEIKEMCANSIVKEFSFVTNKIFKCNEVESGYVQDYSGKLALIAPKPLNEDIMKTYVEKLNNKAEGSIATGITQPSGDETLQFYQYDTVLVIGNSKDNFADLIRGTGSIKCVNSKNKLEAGLKTVKTDPDQGSYINIHDMKTTDFSPSCLFVKPAVNNPRMFVKVDLDTNSLYNFISKQVSFKEELNALDFPPNSIFWDNIESAIQLFGFLKVVNIVHSKLSALMFAAIDDYYKSRDAFVAFKRIYLNFESIILSFYDKITTRLSIDNIVALHEKVGKFISDYVYQKNELDALANVRNVLKNLPNVFMMRNFVNTNTPLDLAYAISKLIGILKSAKIESDSKSITDLFKTVGYLCQQVLFDGEQPMIPKIRSKIAFLGGLSSDLKPEEFKNNVKFLVEGFRGDMKGYKDRLKDAEKPLVFQKIADVDDLLGKIIKNTISKMDSDYLRRNADDIVERVKADPSLITNLRENLKEMEEMNTQDQLEKYGNFLDDDIFTSYLKTIHDMANIVAENGGEDIPVDVIINTMKVQRGKKKKKVMVFKKRLGVKPKEKDEIFEIAKMPKADAINVSRKQLVVLSKLIPEKNKENFANGINNMMKDVGKIIA